MSLIYPYALDVLAACLNGPEIPLALQRYDERSGSGDGRFWAATMARPLWGASYALYAKHAAHAREINALIYALDGMDKTMLWADPYYRGPASGVTTGYGAVSVGTIRADRGAITLTGLPPNFVLTAGDYLSIDYGSGHVYFGTFAEGGQAGSAGNIQLQKEVRPYLPLGIQPGAAVRMVRPYFKAIVTDFTPFAHQRGTRRRSRGDGASITILQKP